MKKYCLLLLLVPYTLVTGLGYGMIAHKLVRDREPWFTLCLFGGLAITISLIACISGIAPAWAIWTFASTGGFYLMLRLLFGQGNAVEMLGTAQIIAILMLLGWPAYQQVRLRNASKQACLMRTPAAP